MCAPDPQTGKVFSSAQIGGLCWARARSIDVGHIDLVRFGIFHEQLAVMQAWRRGDADPSHYTDKTPVIKDDDTVVDLDTLSFESVYVWGTLP